MLLIIEKGEKKKGTSHNTLGIGVTWLYSTAVGLTRRNNDNLRQNALITEFAPILL